MNTITAIILELEFLPIEEFFKRFFPKNPNMEFEDKELENLPLADVNMLHIFENNPNLIPDEIKNIPKEEHQCLAIWFLKERSTECEHAKSGCRHPFSLLRDSSNGKWKKVTNYGPCWGYNNDHLSDYSSESLKRNTYIAIVKQ